MLLTSKKIDLTHTLNSTVPMWSSGCGFKSTITKDYTDACRIQQFEMVAGIGTHMDAPAHFIPEGKDIANLALENLMVPAFMIDVSVRCESDYLISVGDILNFEKQFEKISANSLVIFYTGWSRHWNEPIKYRNEDKNGQLHFPSVGADAAKLLLERGIAGIGIDTLSPDVDLKFPVHHLLLGAGKYIVENVANAHLLPPVGSHVITLPLKIEGGTESPVRMVGLI